MTSIRALALMLLCGQCYAQNLLEPCDGYIRSPYSDGVQKIIDHAVPQPSLLHLATLPSFQNESGLRLVGNEVYFVQFKSFYWGDSIVYNRKGEGRMDFSRPPRVSTTVSHAPLSEPVARRIEKVYTQSIARAKRSNQAGLDGVSYVFATANGDCASAWSPQAVAGKIRAASRRRRRHHPAVANIGEGMINTQRRKTLGVAAAMCLAPSLVMADEMDTGGAPGMVTGIVRAGQPSVLRAYGFADVQAGKRVTMDTVFHIASVSKVVTGTVMMMLSEDGGFALDDPIASVLDFPVVHPQFPDTPITFRHLFNHTSGISDALYWKVPALSGRAEGC